MHSPQRFALPRLTCRATSVAGFAPSFETLLSPSGAALDMISTLSRRYWFVRSVSAALVVVTSVAAAAPGDLDVRVFDSPAGERYYAASFAAVPAPARPAAMDLLIVVDTSASQVGPFRTTTLAAVEACLTSLHPQDRVELVAADLDARVLTEAPAAPGSPEMNAAVAKLNGVTPLGASELRNTIEMAADRLADRGDDRRRALLYIGDGLAMGESELAGAWATTVDQLRQDRVAVSSFAVGPQSNPGLLAALANMTGGNLWVDASGIASDEDEARRRGQRVGRVLADWAHAEVVWPESAAANEAVISAYPTEMPPLRSDRDTVVIGRLSDDATLMEVDALDANATLAWSATLPDTNEDNAYLATLVVQAERDGGMSLTTLGSAGLDATAGAIVAENNRLTRIAEQAVAMGDTVGAARISQAVLRRDPGNVRAKTVQHGVGEGEEALSFIRTVQLEVVDATPIEAMPTPAVPSDAYPAPSQPVYQDQGFYPPAEVVADGRFLNSVDRNRSVFAQLLEKEVQTSIATARDQMSRDPEQAIQDLKLTKQSVERAPELVASVRVGLIDRLESALREASRQSVIKDELDRERAETLAAAEERRLLLDRMAQKRERMKQLVERFDALIDERRFAEATEVAEITEEVDPNGVVPRVVRVWGEQKRYHEHNMELRARRAAMFIETLAQAEESFMPFPDNEPMVFPDAERWREITRLREKYKAVDVAGESPSEKAITDALSSSLPAGGLEFPDGTPLEEVVDYLRSEYEIEIVLDVTALDELGLGPDEPIQVNLRNVSLKSALRRMLEPLELTYVIDNEVLLVTTEEEALTKLAVKVYPVADLVIPIPPPQAGGIGGGGGGGAFSVPDDNVPRDLAAVRLTKRPRTLRIETDTKPESVSEPKANLASVSESANVASLDLPEVGADTAAWDALFENTTVETAAVRRATRRLMKKKRYGDTTNLIDAAIRAGQQQAWMYESLGIAMQLDGKPTEEIERAILSAVDLADSPGQLIAIADYLAGMGMDRRAVQVYRLVLKAEPLLQEVLGPALAAAKRSEDTEAIRWVTAAILERPWPSEMQAIADEARRTSEALATQLEADGETRLADRFRSELAEAKRRDCVVRIQWTGEADVDLSVKEPGGAICWAGEPRTAGGGARIEVPVSDTDSGVKSESYECPRGFAGKYEVLISKAWGEVVAGAVTVEITVGEGTEHAETKSQQVKLDEAGQALVQFDAPAGRRVEPIDEAQLAEALKRQDTIARSVVAQQISSLADETSVSLRPDQRRRRRQAIAGQGNVGFQPQITVLPEGTQLQMSAVVSADRRYVRVSPTPSFTGIGDVFTFSFSGGGLPPNAGAAAAAAQPGGANGGGAGGAGGGLGGAGGGLGGGGGGLGGGGAGGGGGAF